MMGIEPTIFRFEVGRLIHWATRPYDVRQISSIKNDEYYHQPVFTLKITVN